MKNILGHLKGDGTIWIFTIVFFFVSLLSVYSFVPILVKTEGGSPMFYLVKHFMYIVIGFFVMYRVHIMDPKYIGKLAKFAFFVSIILLVFTLFFGVRVNEASRWIRIPFIGLTFQTSDLVKLTLMIYLSRTLVIKANDLNDWRKGFLPVMFPILLVVGLIAKDNLSTAVLIFIISFLLLFIAKVPAVKLFLTVLVGAASFGILVLIHFAFPALQFLPRLDTWISRFFKAYGENVDVVSNAQAINAELAIHNGGYFGVGPGNGELKLYLPEAYADFFFSSFFEEFGLFTSLIIIFLYLILFYRIIRIGLNADKLFDTYVCIGIGLIFITQALVNMLVCTGLIPVTGQNMPLLAMGGSAMVMSCLSLGIVLSIANKSENKNSVASSPNETV